MLADSLVTIGFTAQVLGMSVIAGTLGSMLGLGGGVIIIPGLTLLMGVDIRYAVGASIVAVIATSSGAAAAYLRDRLTNVRLAMLLEIATTLGALSGAVLAGWVSSRVLYLVFAAALSYSAWAMLGRTDKELPHGVAEHPWSAKLGLASSYPDPALGREVGYVVAGLPLGLGLMYAAGVLSGLLGIGAGSLKVPAMDRVMRLPMKVSTATSNFMIGVTAAGSAWIYYGRGDIPPLLAAPVALGVLGGSAIGTRLLMRMRSERVRVIFVGVLLIIAVQMVLRGFGIRAR
jgi:uncharacterized membrane protein YfcA